MNEFQRAIIIVSLSVMPAYVAAYELVTHGMLTYKAYQRSVLADTGMQEMLGIENGEKPFGEGYYDIDSMNGVFETSITRKQNVFEEKIIKEDVDVRFSLSIEGWLMTGAIREDDITDPDPDNGQPVNDPHNENANLE
ncbi:MAG: hypothetical protein FD120_148, partial [Gammaproteobacteria bacterium]